jgi:hypothetical protein
MFSTILSPEGIFLWAPGFTGVFFSVTSGLTGQGRRGFLKLWIGVYFRGYVRIWREV